MTNPRCFYTIFLLLLIGLLCSSCSKEKQAVSAEITIISPLQFTEFNISDTVMVKVTVKSEVKSVDVSVQLLNEQFVAKQPARIIDNLQTNQELLIPYPIADSSLADGIYILRVQASGDIQTAVAYRKIYINEIPQVLKSIWLVGETAEKITVRVYNAGYQMKKEILIDSDYGGSAVSSGNGQFYIAGNKRGSITAYNGQNQSPEWFIPGIPSPNQPYFTFVRAFDNVCYAGFWQGQVIGFNKFGGAIQATAFNENTVPVDAFVHDIFLLKPAYQRSNSGQKLIEIYFLNSGEKINEQNITFEPVGFSAPEFRKILILGNSNENAAAFLINPSTGLISNPYQPFSFPPEKIITTAKINDNAMLLAMESGVYIYDYEKSLTKISDLPNITAIAFNHLNQTVFIAAGNLVFVMNLQGNVFFQLDAQMPLLNVHLLFNK